ncbi:MAG TPA: methylmalonyl-CoA mutase family protein [Candidatus Tectomicrobia bacterium]|nr:methylmalonyl-CoA mutase family protein [Candidatus Tectomicrobia bacterium]
MPDEKDLERIQSAKSAWESQTLQKTLERLPERQSPFTTMSGIRLDRLYTPLDLRDLNYLSDLGFPGEYPFTRGVQPSMYRGRLWTMRQYAGFGTAEESNQRYKYLLNQGLTGLSVAFDLPTQIGYDSDHQMAAGEVGKVGVAIDSIHDMETLFAGIPLDKVSTSMTINATAAILLALYVAVAKKQGVDPTLLQGTLQNDILKEYIARGTYIFPPEPSMRLVTDVFAYGKDHLPRWNPISISGYHMREAGCTAVQELAFTLADGMTYVEAALRAGLSIDSFASRLSFFFGVHNDFLEEIAKFRAARRLWARLMRERFQAKDPRSCMLRFHTQTCGCTLTAQQPENNIVRVTLQALAAVLGGTQSLHTNALDEALALPSELAVRIALRTQQILASESGVADVADPVGGAYAIEVLTRRLEEEALAYIDAIEARGGMLPAIEQGYVQQEIQRSAYDYQRGVEQGHVVVVGVNEYVMPEERPIELMHVDQGVADAQLEKLSVLKQHRDSGQVAAALERLHRAAQGTTNLVPIILEAVQCGTTLGEISDTLRDVFGEYREKVTL